ncbi:MAG: polyprenyl synthetase family protein [Anaerolineae bacterium]
MSEVYALLASVLSVPEVDGDYTRALRTVLDDAQGSEQAGFPLALLPLLTCQAAGGDPRQALPVAAAWRALHIAAKLLDDVEDGDVARMSAAPTDPPRVINLATGFITAAGLALAQLAADGDERLWHTLHHDFGRTVLQMAGGQHADLSQRNTLDRSAERSRRSLDGYRQIMAAKSGACFALAARAGARCATLDEAQIARFDRFGYHVGILIQIADDLHGFRQPAGEGDLAAGRRTLPTLYALAVASPPERARLERLLARASSDAQAEAEAQQLIAALGAVAYLLAEIARYRRRALAVLESGSEADPACKSLRDWLTRLQPPIW